MKGLYAMEERPRDRRNTHLVGFCHRYAVGESCVGCGDSENGVALEELPYRENYGKCLERERVYLQVIDDLMTAMASDSRMRMSEAYNRSARRLAKAKEDGILHK